MNLVVLKTPPQTRFHFGKVSLDDNTALNDTDEVFHSDSLFSAFVHSYIKRHDTDDPSELFEAVLNEKLRFSSVFPCLCKVDSDEKIINFVQFFPKPFSYEIGKLTDPTKIKTFKRIKFVSKGILDDATQKIDLSDQDFLVIQGKYLLKKEEIKTWGWSDFDLNTRKLKLLGSSTSPKVKVHTTEQEGTYYAETTLEIIDNRKILPSLRVNWGFLAEIDPTILDEFKALLYVLCYHGIGGNVSSGSGSLHGFEMLDFDLPNIENPQYLALSLVLPRDLAEFQQSLYHRLSKRGGRRVSGDEKHPIHLKLVNMLAEGSIFTNKINGKIADLKPNSPLPANLDVPYWRNGCPLFYPIPS